MQSEIRGRAVTRPAQAPLAARHPLLLLLAISLLACSEPDERQTAEPLGEPGLPPAVAKIVVGLSGGSVVDCTGTLIHENWVLTSAHCFSEAPAQNFATIQAFGASVRIAEVLVHPEATFEGNPQPGEYANRDIVAVHDLALMPLRFAVSDQPIATTWQPEPQDVDALADLELSYARSHAGDQFTAEARVNGLVDAADLLEDGQPGQLLAATGPVPAGGDSGGGAFLPGEPDASSTPLLVGVVQDAPLAADVGRFGLVPLWPDSHREFIDQALSSSIE